LRSFIYSVRAEDADGTIPHRIGAGNFMQGVEER
jgi:hypothetical protein